jgi:KDEL-tailed cysteine endopeptidase
MTVKALLTLTTFCLCMGLFSSILIDHTDEAIQRKIIKSFMEGPKKELFKVYHFLYEKSYNLNSEEGIKRYKIFKESLKLVKEVNSQNLSYTLGINKFSDLTREEFRSMSLSSYKKEDMDGQEFNVEASATFNDLQPVDHSMYMSPVRSQQSCGSCWAFATTSGIEANYNKLSNITDPKQKFNLSPQDLIDCRNDSEYDACDGGNTLNATKETVIRGVLFEAENEYDAGFTREKKTCPSLKRMNMVTEVEYCLDCNREQFFTLLVKGPVMSSMDGEGNSHLQHYEQGILESLPCENRNHAVVIVAFTGRENGVYKIQNSWGQEWGENGTFRLRRTNDKKSCFIERRAVLPIVTKIKDMKIPPTPAPKCMRVYSECYGKGSSIEVCSSKADLSIVIKSLREYKEKGKYQIFTQKNCGGLSYLPKSNVQCFAESGITDAIQSIYIDDGFKPKRGCIAFYSDSCHSNIGNLKPIEICEDIKDLTKTLEPWGKVNVKSLKMGEGVKVAEVFTDANFNGIYSRYENQSFDISETFKKSLKSIRLLK